MMSMFIHQHQLGVGEAAPRSLNQTHVLSLCVYGLYVAALCVLVPNTSVPASLSQQAVTHTSTDKVALDIHTDWLTAEVRFALYYNGNNQHEAQKPVSLE